MVGARKRFGGGGEAGTKAFPIVYAEARTPGNQGGKAMASAPSPRRVRVAFSSTLGLRQLIVSLRSHSSSFSSAMPDTAPRESPPISRHDGRFTQCPTDKGCPSCFPSVPHPDMTSLDRQAPARCGAKQRRSSSSWTMLPFQGDAGLVMSLEESAKWTIEFRSNLT